MEIQKATTKEQIENNFLFFKKLWKKEFDIDFDKKPEKQKKDFYIPSELGNIKYYAKFGFETFGKSVKIGNSEYIYMKNI